LCGDILPLIPSHDFEAQSAHLSAEFACALRMSGDQLRSKSVLESISDHRFPNHKKQSTLLDLALCHQSLGEISEAQVVARQIIEINPHSGYGLHAEAILIELASDDPNRMQKLEALESRSRKQDATVVAGNIALFRARHARDNPDEVRNILAPLIQSKSNADFYNKIRAVVELAEISLKNNEPLADIDRTNLVRAYHFVFNEQMPNLFDRCHAALWRDFSERGDLSNLLVLFRHSSLRWRLRGREDREKLYLGRLRAILGDVITRTLAKVEKEITYYLVRASYYPTREP
jgi:hypothetical protein